MLRFLSVLGLVAAASALEMPTLYGKFSATGIPGKNSFFTIPRTTDEAEGQGWEKPEETQNNTLFSTYCEPNNPNICILVDNKGSIAGYQICIPQKIDSLNIPGFDYKQKGFKDITLFNQDLYCNQIWFVRQEVLTNGGRDFDGQTGEGLWLQAGDTLTQTPLNETEMKNQNNTRFVKQNCFFRMGQHYFWDARPDLTPEEFLPWFTLFNKQQQLSGFGFIAIGGNAVTEEQKGKYMEDVSSAAIRAIAPDSPKWISDAIDEYGILAHHVYWTVDPWKTTC